MGHFLYRCELGTVITDTAHSVVYSSFPICQPPNDDHVPPETLIGLISSGWSLVGVNVANKIGRFYEGLPAPANTPIESSHVDVLHKLAFTSQQVLSTGGHQVIGIQYLRQPDYEKILKGYQETVAPLLACRKALRASHKLRIRELEDCQNRQDKALCGSIEQLLTLDHLLPFE